MEGMDYKKIGLKCGIEIHQQLDTKQKLFCKCKSRLAEHNPVMEVIRKLRPVVGETGEIDTAVLYETMRNKKFHYFVYPEESCLVELDEEPPHEPNPQALRIALTIAELLKCDIPDEIHFMRKIVIDGSNTSGFQRTAIIGLNGKIKTSFGDVGITNVCLEEESCKIIKRDENRVFYGLDRLGIPLVEIGTSPDIHTPEQAKEVAQKLGMLVRSTIVKRGLGTIRQDINVSIKDGARVEIKGAQDLKLIPKLVEHEAMRQVNLIKIRDELKKSGFRPVKPKHIHVSHIFSDSESRITKGKTTYALLIPNFAGFLKRRLTPTRTLGNEIASYVKAETKLKGIIHSDEDLSRYRLSGEFEILRKHLKARKNDTLIIAAGEEDEVKKTMEVIAKRINQLLIGVPEETRKALDNGDTEYLRPLPGSERMYPETDVMPIKITKNLLNEIKENLPEVLEVREKREIEEIRKKTKLSDELTVQLVRMGRKRLFDRLVGLGYDPKIVSTTLTVTLRYLERKEKVNISKIDDRHLIETFEALRSGRISKEAIPEVLKCFADNPNETIELILEKTGLKPIGRDKLKEIVKKVIEENKNLVNDPRGEDILFGLVMRKVRGRARTDIVKAILKKEIKKFTNTHTFQ